MNTNTSYYNPISWEQVYKLDKNCPLCLEDPREKEEWVAHDPSHPIHKSCAKNLLLKGRVTCITCNDPLPLSLSEKFGYFLIKNGPKLTDKVIEGSISLTIKSTFIWILVTQPQYVAVTWISTFAIEFLANHTEWIPKPSKVLSQIDKIIYDAICSNYAEPSKNIMNRHISSLGHYLVDNET